jgi:AbrB family looped-hinge helix DNA binding protein
MKKRIEMQEVTRVSSKGQIVIPSSIREGMGVKEGSLFSVAARKNMIVLKKLDKEMTAEDVRTLKMLEEAWKDIEKGRYKVATPEEFFKEMERWKRKK